MPSARALRTAATALAIVLALTASGCGSGSARPKPGTPKAEVLERRVEQVAHQASLRAIAVVGNTTAPSTTKPAGHSSGASRARHIPGPHVTLPPPSRPYAAGALTATYHITLRGGRTLTPPGPYPRAGGRALVKIYGHTETCWKFTGLHGVTRPRLTGLASGANGTDGLITFFTTTYRSHGCVTGIPATTLEAAERDPHGYAVLLEDHHYIPSLVGEL